MQVAPTKQDKISTKWASTRGENMTKDLALEDSQLAAAGARYG